VTRLLIDVSIPFETHSACPSLSHSLRVCDRVCACLHVCGCVCESFSFSFTCFQSQPGGSLSPGQSNSHIAQSFNTMVKHKFVASFVQPNSVCNGLHSTGLFSNLTAGEQHIKCSTPLYVGAIRRLAMLQTVRLQLHKRLPMGWFGQPYPSSYRNCRVRPVVKTIHVPGLLSKETMAGQHPHQRLRQYVYLLWNLEYWSSLQHNRKIGCREGHGPPLRETHGHRH
jgi:hypothetical protein